MIKTARTKATNDLRNKPAYAIAEAARYLKVPAATLRSWVVGREYTTSGGPRHFKALVAPAEVHPPVLSFWNLIEAHVLRALRTEHGVSVKEVRSALRFAQSELRIERLLLSQELAADAGKLFLDRYGELIDLSASGQIAMRQVLEAHLKRVEWDEWRFPVRLYPFLSTTGASDDAPIVIDPEIAFGRPVVASRGISTSVITQRIDAGESIAALAEDYDLSPREIEEAILYEKAA